MEDVAVDQTECNSASVKETPNFKTCEQCQLQFAPRSKSGGRPQRFCSPQCRGAFHSGANVSQRRSPHVGLPAIIETPVAKQPPNESTAFVFDWNGDDVILAEQQAVAVYWNPRGDLVIRQQAWMDDDSIVLIAKNNVAEFIDKLCDVAGIPSVGR
jgi:hypothetical protein